MENRVGEMEVHYRIPGSMPQAHAAIPGLDRLCRQDLPGACQSAILQLLGGERAVYVIREVRARIVIRTGGAELTEPIARAWGEHIAGAAARVLAHGEEGIDFVRFENQADFVARFLADLVHGHAGALWFYGAFARYLAMPRQQTVLRVLEDNREHSAVILRLLRERGQLESILASVDEESAKAFGAPPAPVDNRLSVEPWRPVLMAALGIASALGAETTLPPEHDIRWLESLQASLAVPSGEPAWNDPVRLAAHVFHVLDFLCRAGHIRWTEKVAAANAPEILRRGFDWLPLDWLLPRVLELRSGSASSASFDRPAAHSPTPRQEQFLALLLRVVREKQFEAGASTRRAMAYDRIRIRAALAAHSPAFCDDPHLMVLLDAILTVRDSIHSGASEGAAAGELERSRKIVAGLGPTADALLQSLGAQQRDTRIFATGGEEFTTSCGAVFLLTRGVLDLRLDAILKSSGAQSPSAFLAGLAMKAGGPLDDGARLWAGFDGDDPCPELSKFPIESFRQSLLAIMIAQRHLPSGEIPLTPGSLGRLAEPIESCPAAIDHLLTETTVCVIRAWARWLRGIGESSPAYLLKNTLDRKALVRHTAHTIDVTLAPAPLDSIVDLAGYFEPISQVPWLGNREMRFARGTR